ncbi:MAG: DNA gyrase subunit A [Parcubacteria group bacterium]|nr:DNA gyrase subunit A [Parcubacteria group bacterium]
MAAKKDDKKAPAERPLSGIVSRSITTEMRESYLAYAMSVIVSRALPDARDGLKPVHRRILYTMNKLGLSAGGKTRKSATVVGEVMGKLHPHGDAAIYDALAKLTQDFSMRYPLIIGQGNFGSIDGDNPAAMRYTEAKMSRLGGEMLKDIEKETVDFIPNYDNTEKEPIVLPSMVPNLLINGTLGIAVGMATNIPPHNLREVCDATAYLIDNPKATTEDLLQFVQGPDFPTGCIAFNQKDIAHAYATGRGGVVVRGEAEIVEGKKGDYQIIITSIPFRVNKADLLQNIANLVHDKKIEGIKDVRDESTTDIRVAIDLKSSGHPQTVLNALYKHTQLEETFHYNTVALVDGVPQTLSLKGLIEPFIAHRKEVVTRRTRYDLAVAKAREHILEGLKKALDHIDEIIKLIKKSPTVAEAHAGLMKTFKFSAIQATAILEMRLQKLAGLERKKIEDELKAVRELIAELESLLASEKKMLTLIKKEISEIAEKYGDDRRTKIVKREAKVLSPEDLVADEESVLVLTRGGYVKRTNPGEYRKQKRGGVGVVDLDTKEEDVVSHFLTASAHSDILFFSDKGKAYQLKMYDIPEGKRATRGKSVMNFLSIEQGENINSVLALPKKVKDAEGTALVMITKNGTVKKTDAEHFYEVRRSGLIAISLDKDDALISAHVVRAGDDVVITTSKGQAIRFKEKDVRSMGRTAAGVRGIKLKKGDSVVGSGIVPKGEKDYDLFVLLSSGYGKRTPLKEYKVQGRGGGGIKTANVTTKTGELVSAHVVTGKEELVAVSQKGQVIRTELSEIRASGRATQGVRVMRLYENDKIAACVALAGETEGE